MENKDLNDIQSNIKTIEIDGHIFRIKREFANEGSTILEGLVSMLLDRLEQEEKFNNV